MSESFGAYQNPFLIFIAFVLCTEARLLLLDLFLLIGLDAFVSILIPRNAVLLLCGQGGYVLDEGAVIPSCMSSFSAKLFMSSASSH